MSALETRTPYCFWKLSVIDTRSVPSFKVSCCFFGELTQVPKIRAL